MVHNANFTLALTDFKIAGRSVWDSLWFNTVQLTEKECVNCTYANIDSSIQFLVLPSGAYEAVKSLFQQQLCPEHNVGPVGICSSDNFFDGDCFILDDSTLGHYPTIELTFANGVELRIPPTNYLVDYGGKSCLAFGSGAGDTVIIGNRVMQEYYTIFQTSQNRIGFAKTANCSGAEYKVIAVSGDNQYGYVGRRLAKPLVVQVIRLNDSMPVEGVNVTFNVVDIPPPTEVMWIASAIWKAQSAKLEPTTVITSAEGIAQTYLYLAGAADQNTVTADIPLCLNHVVFIATGQQNYVWRLLTYIFLFGLVTGVVVLNLWYSKTTKRRNKIHRFNSNLNLSSSNLFANGNGYEASDNHSDPLTTPPLSPSFSRPPEISKLEKYENESINDNESNYSVTTEDDDEDPLQYPQPNSRKWYHNVPRKLHWYTLRAGKQLQNLVYGRKR